MCQPCTPSPSPSNRRARSEVSWYYSGLSGCTLGKPYPNKGVTRRATRRFPRSRSLVVPVGQRLSPSRWRQEVTPRRPHLRAPAAASPAGLEPREGAGLRAWWCVDGGICPSRVGSLGTFARLSKCGNFCPSSLL